MSDGKKRFGCIGIILLVLLCLSVLFNFALIASRGARTMVHSADNKLPEFSEETVAPSTGASTDKIVVIGLKGIISSSVDGSLGDSMVDDIKIALRQATEDNNVKAIVLNVDSPGGEVTASDVIYNAVKNARSKKPVVVYMGSLAASGGFYVSCGGSWLMANETTLTGSIGVIIETLNYRQLLDKIGVSPVVFKSGAFKDMLSGSRDMTPEEQAYIQAMVKQTYEKFEGIVSSERNIPLETLNPIADGRVISGKDALEDKLINQLGQIEDAYEKAKELGKTANAAVVRYKPGFKLGKLFQMLGESNHESKVEINLTQKLMPPLEPGKLYLLPSYYAE